MTEHELDQEILLALDEAEKIKAENERLRVALKRIVDNGNGGLIGGGYAYGVAFAALYQQKQD